MARALKACLQKKELKAMDVYCKFWLTIIKFSAKNFNFFLAKLKP